MGIILPLPRPSELLKKYDSITADFTYIGWLGDRKEIEKITKVWDKTIVDRTNELQEWVKYCQKIQKRGVTIYAYANNHYSGFGPATIERFRGLRKENGVEIPPVQLPMKLAAPTLFDAS
jgi:uncharacterized protein YecE (DUF72 family)